MAYIHMHAHTLIRSRLRVFWDVKNFLLRKMLEGIMITFKETEFTNLGIAKTKQEPIYK